MLQYNQTPTPFSLPYFIIAGKSKLGMATFVASALKLNAGPYHFQSNKMYCKLCFTAKSIFSFASAVVCVITLIILPGFIQLTSLILEAALRLRIMLLCSIKSPGFSPAMITRHGVPTGEIKSAGVYIDVTIVFGFSL